MKNNTDRKDFSITHTRFSGEELLGIPRGRYSDDWPVVYILKGKKQAYVGETLNFLMRMKAHLRIESRKNVMTDAYRIEDEQFNKSSATHLESFLIEFMAADGKFELQNRNSGLRNHNYYNRDRYLEHFGDIWDKLIDLEIVLHDLNTLKNSDLFKMSPFKTLSFEQLEVVKKITRTLRNEETSASVVKGVPGTGKTVLGVYLMKYLIDFKEFQDKKIGIVIPMKSLRKTLKKVFRTVKGLSPRMVLGPSDITHEKYDILIVDESHRLMKRNYLANNYSYDEATKRLGLPPDATQIEWIRNQCSHLVLLYDPDQTIKPSDVNPETILSLTDGNKNWYTLTSQFRVKTDFDYIGFIENILNMKSLRLGPPTKKELGNYDLRLFDDPLEMTEEIRKRNSEKGLSRLTAGYAWFWKTKNDLDNPYLFDIEEKNLKVKWNTKTEDWVNSPGALREAGSIHTVQGYDLNYCGVIIGRDLIMEDGRIKFNRKSYFDKKTRNDEEMLVFIKNIYRVLLTRGIYGTYIYVCDEQLRDYFRKFIPSADEGIKEMPFKVAEDSEGYLD